jgi:hypothetical protein
VYGDSEFTVYFVKFHKIISLTKKKKGQKELGNCCCLKYQYMKELIALPHETSEIQDRDKLTSFRNKML